MAAHGLRVWRCKLFSGLWLRAECVLLFQQRPSREGPPPGAAADLRHRSDLADEAAGAEWIMPECNQFDYSREL